jgi:predicted anti-sigma-YlaC factor YlaD
MTPGTWWKLATALAVTLTASGCTAQRWAINKAGDALAADGSIIARDDDPDFVRAAVPFSLELMESLLAKNPQHTGLLLAAASGFTQYSYAFVQLDADLLEDQDYTAASLLRQRAKRLYARARDYGLRGLEARHPHFTATLRGDAGAAAQSLQPADVPLAYWTAVAWAAAISQAKDDPDLIGDLPQVDALAERVAILDPDFGAGALQSFLITYEMSRAARADVARAHFAKAISLSGGRSAAAYVALAESVCVPQRARSEYLQLLDQALAIDPDRYPNNRLENLIVQRRARWLRQRVDELFLPDQGMVQPEGKP